MSGDDQNSSVWSMRDGASARNDGRAASRGRRAASHITGCFSGLFQTFCVFVCLNSTRASTQTHTHTANLHVSSFIMTLLQLKYRSLPATHRKVRYLTNQPGRNHTNEIKDAWSERSVQSRCETTAVRRYKSSFRDKNQQNTQNNLKLIALK